MPKYPIDLGRKMGSPECSPVNGDTYYPTLHLEWEDNYDLPESGEITVKFKKVAETNSERRGETRQSVELEITELCRVKAAKSGDKDEDRGQILDKILKEVEGE